MPTQLPVRRITPADSEYPALLEFRNRMLREPLGLDLFSESLEQEKNDVIFIASENGAIAGCVMLHPLPDHSVQLRQMAVGDAWQGKGIGTQLLQAAESYAMENSYKKIILHARITATAFYQRYGYTPFGNIFTEVTIPHIAMEKEIC